MPKSPNWERNWSVAAHLAGILGVLSLVPMWKPGLYLGIPLLNVLIPYLLWKRGSRYGFFVDHHGCEAVNFQVTVTVFATLIVFLAWSASGIGLVGVQMFCVIALAILFIFNAAMSIWAAVRTYDRQTFTYPLSWRPFKMVF